ncbi:PREDICTED: WRKY transcription factor 55 [Nicotiana attenuata]|uniref:Wrky transcription factor 55 n=1 Tax=Nicotiana attenuata TaxID=49451 RepID=A0A1J6J0X6_NICAT|nr:PREDICTED: WRKY transcription factor 55 [Nicotiana attenuata]OIT03551.1 wrky transcription factor 55 [Nicotiana attenuata]
MDETTATILYGCKLAKELEANLPNWANQPQITLNKTEEIVAVFNNVKERLSHHHHQQQQQALEFFHAAEMLGDQRQATAAFAVHGLPPAQESDQMGVSDSTRGGGSSSSSSQRQRRRAGDTDTRTVRVAAPRMGNLELPPEDGYTWRKYGQKEILGSRFPRAYYRCTHQKLYNCLAKKQVQRLDNDPYVFEVTYRSQHTCYMPATAPTVPPPLMEKITHQTITILPPPHLPLRPPPTPASLSAHWLTMDIKPQGDQGTSTIPFDIQRDFGHSTGGSLASICNVMSRDGGGAGPSGVRYGREVDYQLQVVDMADAMFNYSGSCSNNSMDIIFSSIDDKWDSAEKKE